MARQVYDDKGRALTLQAALGRGGEGEVFSIAGRPELAAKIIVPARRKPGKYEKLTSMVARPPTGAYHASEGFPVLTWPRTLLYETPTRQGFATFVGYAMSRVQGRDFVPFYQVTAAGRRQGLGGAPLTWDRLVLLGLRLCHIVRTLHRFGYAVGDMNDRNVLVSRRFTPLFMDTDSFQVPRPRGGHFPSIVGDQMYWAPELLDVDLTKFRGSRVQGDLYALGVLLFQLFMNGLRPYQARGSRVAQLETLMEKTREGHYPWADPKPGVLEPPAGAPDYGALPKPVRSFFERCFVDGHGRPKRRPTADAWYRTLLKIQETGYRTCLRNKVHVYGRDTRGCPWCRDPNDPFGGGDAASRPRSAQRPSTRRAPARSGRTTQAKPKPPKKQAKAPAKTTRRKKPPQRPLPPSRSSSSAPPPGAGTSPRGPPPRRLDHWSVRALWILLLAAAFASPTAVLRLLSDGVEKMVVTALATILFVFALGLIPIWRWLHASRSQMAVIAGWLVLVAALTLAVGWSGRWVWLDYTTGAASFALGALVFAALERGRPDAFRPRRRGAAHAAAGLSAAYVPSAVAWAWVQW